MVCVCVEGEERRMMNGCRSRRACVRVRYLNGNAPLPHVNALLMRFRDLSTRDDLLYVYKNPRIGCCFSHNFIYFFLLFSLLPYDCHRPENFVCVKKECKWNTWVRSTCVATCVLVYTFYASSTIKPGDYGDCRCIVSIFSFLHHIWISLFIFSLCKSQFIYCQTRRFCITLFRIKIEFTRLT